STMGFRRSSGEDMDEPPEETIDEIMEREKLGYVDQVPLREDELRDPHRSIKIELLSIIAAYQGPVRSGRILGDYFEINGVQLDPKKHGFKSFSSMMRTFTDKFVHHTVEDRTWYSAKKTERSGHLQDLIQNQITREERKQRDLRRSRSYSRQRDSKGRESSNGAASIYYSQKFVPVHDDDRTTEQRTADNLASFGRSLAAAAAAREEETTRVIDWSGRGRGESNGIQWREGTQLSPEKSSTMEDEDRISNRSTSVPPRSPMYSMNNEPKSSPPLVPSSLSAAQSKNLLAGRKVPEFGTGSKLTPLPSPSIPSSLLLSASPPAAVHSKNLLARRPPPVFVTESQPMPRKMVEVIEDKKEEEEKEAKKEEERLPMRRSFNRPIPIFTRPIEKEEKPCESPLVDSSTPPMEEKSDAIEEPLPNPVPAVRRGFGRPLPIFAAVSPPAAVTAAAPATANKVKKTWRGGESVPDAVAKYAFPMHDGIFQLTQTPYFAFETDKERSIHIASVLASFHPNRLLLNYCDDMEEQLEKVGKIMDKMSGLYTNRRPLGESVELGQLAVARRDDTLVRVVVIKQKEEDEYECACLDINHIITVSGEELFELDDAVSVFKMPTSTFVARLGGIQEMTSACHNAIKIKIASGVDEKGRQPVCFHEVNETTSELSLDVLFVITGEHRWLGEWMVGHFEGVRLPVCPVNPGVDRAIDHAKRRFVDGYYVEEDEIEEKEEKSEEEKKEESEKDQKEIDDDGDSISSMSTNESSIIDMRTTGGTSARPFNVKTPNRSKALLNADSLIPLLVSLQERGEHLETESIKSLARSLICYANRRIASAGDRIAVAANVDELDRIDRA
ncbi:hypothetical protein PFISCL1PPCAC_24256, partial [Pristionchus fissidentatus]